jgi:hypothetical protein
MQGRVILALVGLTAVVAYSAGRQDTPVTTIPVVQRTPLSKPLALATAVDGVGGPTNSTSLPVQPSPPKLPEKPVDKKRIGEVVLTAAAIAAIIVKSSRDQYYATGHPCACPDDLMRNGRACGGRSAYSRPGGAAPLCYSTDVTAAIIESYRNKAGVR